MLDKCWTIMAKICVLAAMWAFVHKRVGPRNDAQARHAGFEQPHYLYSSSVCAVQINSELADECEQLPQFIKHWPLGPDIKGRPGGMLAWPQFWGSLLDKVKYIFSELCPNIAQMVAILLVMPHAAWAMSGSSQT